ncbi:uncharacterized protein [Cicer arietinum]|uniref:Uncharacterized protein LOC101515737 n=1 Tax=Cicer arietinum TaxID=3827 RepID=A0A1S2Z0T0_CICAR|nr:uncharacterized protein LOC101515737 [Cicer arietinum]
MLDGLLGRGFAAKCKSLIKLTKNRIDVIRRKRKATEKFLKQDIVDLLANGLDVNAYGRAEGLIAELTLTSCYDFVEWACEFVLKHLSVLQKLSGCPEECREAISSLMFSAARFSDLPELRELRQIFQERYGNSLECYVNKEFAANVNPKSFTLEKKVRLMQDISSEFSIKWDSKAFELRMSKSSAFAQGHNTYKSDHSVGYNKSSQGKDEILFEKSPDYSKDGHKFRNGKEAAISKGDENCVNPKSKLPEHGLKPLSRYDEVSLPKDSRDNLLPGRDKFTSPNWKEGSMLKPIGCSSQDKRVPQFEDGSNIHDRWGNATHVRESQDTASARKSPSHAGFRSKNTVNEPFAVNHDGLPDLDNSQRKVHETPRVKPYYSNAIPPPYVKPNSKLKNSTQRTELASSHIDNDGITTNPSIHQKPDADSKTERTRFGLDNSEWDLQATRDPRASKQIYEKVPPGLDNSERDLQATRDPRASKQVYEKVPPGFDNSERDLQTTRDPRASKQVYEKVTPAREDAEEVPVLKPKSMRRKHSKSRSTHNDASKEDAEVARKSRSKGPDESKRGLQILFDDEKHKKDEEERVIDRLLIHYSKKPTTTVPEKARRSKSRHAHKMDDGPNETPQAVPHAPRSVSLPHEQSQEVEVKKVFTRAASFQPDRSNEARHVHPKLPDYDDLAARLATLRGS